MVAGFQVVNVHKKGDKFYSQVNKAPYSKLGFGGGTEILRFEQAVKAHRDGENWVFDEKRIEWTFSDRVTQHEEMDICQ